MRSGDERIYALWQWPNIYTGPCNGRQSRSGFFDSLSPPPPARSLRKSIFFAGRKFLTPINHDYLTEASPGGQYILLTKSHVGSRAHFFLLGCRVLHF